MTRVAVFAGPSLKRRLEKAQGQGLTYEFHSPRSLKHPSLDGDGYAGVLMDMASPATAPALRALRKRLGHKPVGGIALRASASTIQRARRLGLDFHLASWRAGDPPAAEVLAEIQSAVSKSQPSSSNVRAPHAAAKRLAILTDVVKTANSILEPRKVIELIMAKIQQLIPCEAWSMLMVDEEKQELVFELALGGKGKEVSAFRVKMGEGIAGWVAQTGQPVIVNDVKRDPRFAQRFDSETRFQTRSMLCAPLISRGRTIGVVQVINRLHGNFSRADQQLLLTLVEPCAIAIENAILFQKAEQLTITDDLTKLFNSRYMNLYISREIKRCKRHGIPISVIFLDLDGFKSINDQFGHLAGSTTLTEVGQILTQCVRESDILARYGGDEFVAVLPETPASGAIVIGERIRKAIEEHVFLAAQGLMARISASIGISSYPDHALTPEGLIQKADQAMYRVKERDKNGIEVAV
jgi:diguanylate cyclase (GGDEF)-like protein